MNNLYPTPVMLDKISNTEILNETILQILSLTDLDQPEPEFDNEDIFEVGGTILKEFQNEIVLPTYEKYLNNVLNISLNEFEHVVKGWVTIPSNGYTNPAHNHPEASFSAVFYLLNEDLKVGGELCMLDPRSNANRAYTRRLRTMFSTTSYIPNSGDIVVFPSYLFHYTTPFKGKIRLAIATDLYLS